MEGIFTPENLERAGTTVALIYAIYINYKMSKDHSKVISNHLDHNTKSEIKLSNSIEKLIKFLEKKFK